MKKIALIAMLAVFSCKQSYSPPPIANPGSYLVVDGFIISGTDSTVFRLTHTFPLTQQTNNTAELNAAVTVEGQDNSSYPLGETGNGLYGASLPNLNSGTLYRLHIRTSAGKEYASDYVPVKTSPPIDSISWTQSREGVQIYANTHDPNNATTYYRWDYSDTWEFHSKYYATITYQNNAITELNPNNIYTCWQNGISSSILLGSSAKLAQDVIYEAPLVFIPSTSQKISVKYSIFVRQYALPAEAYQWWQTLLKNTEQIGGIFGVQPTSNMGNIHNLSNAAEQVVGYISAGTVTKQRIFISAEQIAFWQYSTSCELHDTSPDSVKYFIEVGDLLVSGIYSPPPTRYSYSTASCVDCTLSGTNQRPSFWQ